MLALTQRARRPVADLPPRHDALNETSRFGGDYPNKDVTGSPSQARQGRPCRSRISASGAIPSEYSTVASRSSGATGLSWTNAAILSVGASGAKLVHRAGPAVVLAAKTLGRQRNDGTSASRFDAPMCFRNRVRGGGGGQYPRNSRRLVGLLPEFIPPGGAVGFGQVQGMDGLRPMSQAPGMRLLEVAARDQLVDPFLQRGLGPAFDGAGKLGNRSLAGGNRLEQLVAGGAFAEVRRLEARVGIKLLPGRLQPFQLGRRRLPVTERNL